ncbi:hypothetical protein DFH27DRAFT_642937 [Peziza echinospora]|nr:hypothetical protein DFH27DRAFT_642937 [Peziza echinospora]
MWFHTLLLFISAVCIADVVSAQRVGRVTYTLAHGGQAYAWRGGSTVIGAQTDAQIAEEAYQAAYEMRLQWRNSPLSRRAGSMPQAMTAFTTNAVGSLGGGVTIYFHSSVKGAVAGESVIAEAGIIAEGMHIYFETCAMIYSAPGVTPSSPWALHRTNANCGEILVLNHWLNVNTGRSLTELPETSRIVTIRINEDSSRAWAEHPCWTDGRNGLYGCADMLRHFGIKVCRTQYGRSKRDLELPGSHYSRPILTPRQATPAAKKKAAPAAAAPKQKPVAGGKASAKDEKPSPPAGPAKTVKITAANAIMDLPDTHKAAKKPTDAEALLMVAGKGGPTSCPATKPEAEVRFKCPTGLKPVLKQATPKSKKMLPVLHLNPKTKKIEPMCSADGKPPAAGKPAAGKAAAGKAATGKAAVKPAAKTAGKKPAAGKAAAKPATKTKPSP